MNKSVPDERLYTTNHENTLTVAPTQSLSFNERILDFRF